MPRSRYVLCIAALLCLASGPQHSVFSAAALTAQTPTLQPKPTGTPLQIIQPSDVLEIFVYKEPTISRNNVLVRPDGRISVPLAQDVQAAGLTPAQLKEKLELLLKEKELIDVPNVTVIITAFQSYVVYVTGQVTKVGPIVSQKPLTVFQALIMAGSFTTFAKPNNILIFRGADEDTKTYKFNYEEFTSGKNFSQNMELKSGDAIYVP